MAIIVVGGQKGGSGKSPISAGLAGELGFKIITNETSILENTYKGEIKVCLPELREIVVDDKTATAHINNLPIIDNALYDFKGNIDREVSELAKVADLIILPVFKNDDSIAKTALALIELNEMAKDDARIIAVATRLKNQKDYQEVKTKLQNELNIYYKNQLGDLYDEYADEQGNMEYEIYPLSESTMYTHFQSNGKSFNDIKTNNKVFKLPFSDSSFTYRNHIKEFQKIVDITKEIALV